MFVHDGIISDPPRFIVRPEAQYFRQIAQSVTMPCVAQGTPTPIITWRKVELPLTNYTFYCFYLTVKFSQNT